MIFVTKCNPYRPQQRRQFTDEQRDLIEARRVEHTRLLNRISRSEPQRLAREAQTLSVLSAREMIESRYAAVVRLFPGQSRKITDYLVTLLGQKARFLGLDPSRNYSVAGNVRHTLSDIRQTVEGMINTVGRIRSLPRIDKFVGEFNTISKRIGLDAETSRRLLDDTLTIGQIPRRQSALQAYRSTQQVISASELFNQRRYTAYRRTMQDAGFTPNEVNRLINLGVNVTAVFDELRVLAMSQGVDLTKLEDIGYLTRVATEDFQLRLRDITPREVLDTLTNGAQTISSVFNRNRSGYHLIPEDIAVVSHLLGIATEELEALIEAPSQLRAFMLDNLSSDQIDFLVDSGLMTRLPMSSTELFNYYVSRYELPYKHINEMFKVDPYEAIEEYSRNLLQVTSNAALVRGITDNRAIAAGWAIPDNEFFANPTLYNNFVRMGDVLNSWASRHGVDITTAVRDLGLTDSPEGVSTVIDDFNRTYVHPVVADQWRSAIELSLSPSMLGRVGRFFSRLNSLLNKTTLGIAENYQFVVRNYLGGLISAHAAGMNLEYLPVAFNTVNRVLREGYEWLDDTRPFRVNAGRVLTQRQFVEEFFIKRGQSVAPGITRTPIGRVRLGNSSLSDVGRSILDSGRSTIQALHDIHTYTMAEGAQLGGRSIAPYERFGRLTRATAQKIATGIDNMFEHVAVHSNVADMTFKLGTLMSITQAPDVNLRGRVGQLLTSFTLTNFESFDEAYRHLDEYFVNVYDAGTITRSLGSVFPFLVWRMANPPMVLRHAIREPGKYYAYLRLMALTQEPLEEEPQAVFPSWLLENTPLFISRDERGRPFALIPESYDPILDATSFFRGVGDSAQRLLFNQPVGTQGQIRSQARNEPDDFAIGLLSQTYAPIRITAETVLGMDTLTGRKFEEDSSYQQGSLLGVQMPSWMIAALRNIPGINQLDELNPFDIGGTPTQYDVYGNVIRVGTPSWTGAERTRRDTDDYPFAMRLLRAAGLNVRRIDYGDGLQLTMSDIETTINTLETSINRNTQDLMQSRLQGTVISEREYQRRVRSTEEAIVRWYQLKFDYQRVQQYATSQGIPSRSVLQELQRMRVGVSGLPHPNQDIINQITEEALQWRRLLYGDSGNP